MMVSSGSALCDLLPHPCHEDWRVISCQGLKISERNDFDQLANNCVRKCQLVKVSCTDTRNSFVMCHKRKTVI